MSEPLILISQVQRSGGTLLTRLLDDHPECFAHPYELQWGPKPRSRRPEWPLIQPETSARSTFRRLEEPWISRFLHRGYYDKGHVDRHPFVFDPALQRQLFGRRLFSEPCRSMRDVLDAYFTSFFNAWLDYQGLYTGPKRFVTAFAPGLHMTATSRDGFRRDYADGYLISLVREPVSWFASARHFKVRRPLFNDTDGAIRLWEDSTKATLAAHAARPERTIVLLFEDVVRRTEDAMRWICAVTGLPFSARLLRPTYNGRPVLSDTSFTPRYEVDLQAVDRTAVVPRAEAARILAATGALYESVRDRFALPVAP